MKHEIFCSRHSMLDSSVTEFYDAFRLN
uniref:Uncharacterized protein n=1 Tax=Rhizophora mucronata TaxID=61149 RepID=A0A2P2QX75_RHIMU